MKEIPISVLFLIYTLILFAIIEMFAIHSFLLTFFRLGIPVFKKTIEIEETDIKPQSAEVIKRKEGKFLFRGNQVYFISRFLFNPFRLSTLIPFKLIGNILPDNKIEIVGRLPIGTTSFFLWPMVLGDINMMLFGFGLSTIGFVIWYSLEKARVKEMLGELKTIVIS
jgi:hypothetical protein